MRVAITVGTLRIPPTYFVIAHAEVLRTRLTSEVFTLVSAIADTVSVPVHAAVPRALGSFRRREIAMPAWIPFAAAQIRAFHPDVIHQHFATWSAPAQLAAGRGRPLIVTLHGVDALLAAHPRSDPMSRWHAANIAGAERRATRVLAVSSYLASVAQQGGFDADRLLVHYQGVDTEYFTPGSPRGSTPTVAFVGALAPRKGLRDVLQVSARLHAAGHAHRLLLAGAGPLEADVSDFVDRHPHAIFLGPVGRAGVRDIMRSTDVLAMPSQPDGTWREAAGLTALEAQACGTPVAAYRSGGLPEMVAPETHDRLAEEGDVESLTRNVWSLLQDRGDGPSSLGAAVRSWVCSERSLAGSAGELMGIYGDVAGA